VIEYPYVDELGYYWATPTVFVTVPEFCFVCGNRTPFLDVCFEAHFCDSEECNEYINRQLEAAGPIEDFE
jgi:hypothetical protein